MVSIEMAVDVHLEKVIILKVEGVEGKEQR